MRESICDAGCRDVGEGHGNRPPGCAIDRGKQVLEPVGLGHLDQIDIPVVKSLPGNNKFAYWLNRISGYLSLLTG